MLDPTLLPGYIAAREQAGQDFTLSNYLEWEGTAELAVAYANLFWPTFVEHRGCIVRADGFSEENFDAWWDRTGGSITAIEGVLNHLHVGDLFPNDRAELDSSVYDYIGQTLARMWSARLQQLFPTRTFVVEYQLEEGVIVARQVLRRG